MRYRKTEPPVDARQWQGPHGDLTVSELLDWGAPIIQDPTGDGMGLTLTAGGYSFHVRKGDWVVRHESGGWETFTDVEFRRLYAEAPEDGETDSDPLPGFEQFLGQRVGFRRQVAGEWQWRSGRLTRAEARESGWSALYELQVPEAEQIVDRCRADRDEP